MLVLSLFLFVLLYSLVGFVIDLRTGCKLESLMMNKAMDEMMIGRGGNWIIDGIWRPHRPGSDAKKKIAMVGL